MQPSFGWVLLSRDALSRAETQLRDDITGVRDEIGFLLIHSGYANRFFPGTSVLHTRLRYALFIPWMYQDLLSSGDTKDIARRVSQAEVRLAGRLRHLSGAIGGQSYPESTTQPPTFVYWTALRTWGLLRQRLDGTFPGKSQLHRSISNGRVIHHLTDDDDDALEEAPEYFLRTPSAPSEWRDKDQELTFRLTREERAFLARQLVGVMRPGAPGGPSLLALLAEHIKDFKDDHAEFPWSRAVARYAQPDDQAALKRARAAAALSDIGRGVYNALVETVRDVDDGLPTPSEHRDYLPQVLARSSKKALGTEIPALLGDVGGIPSYLADVLQETTDWLRAPRDLMALRDVYAHAETLRKGRRARLNRTFSGKERRAEWQPGQQTKATPIGYRWSNVLRLLRDLKGGK